MHGCVKRGTHKHIHASVRMSTHGCAKATHRELVTKGAQELVTKSAQELVTKGAQRACGVCL